VSTQIDCRKKTREIYVFTHHNKNGKTVEKPVNMLQAGKLFLIHAEVD